MRSTIADQAERYASRLSGEPAPTPGDVSDAMERYPTLLGLADHPWEDELGPAES